MSANEPEGSDDLSSDRPDKRQRKNHISKVKSCAECRRLKLRCDRQVPCNNCTRRGTGTICPDGVLKASRGRTMIVESSEVLHERIASLENALNLLTSNQGGHPLLQQAYHLESPTGEPPALQQPNQTSGGPILLSPTHSSETSAPPESHPATSLEGHNAHLRAMRGNPQNSQFFGDASSLFLAEQDASSSTAGHVGPNGAYGFRKGWIESFAFEENSALRTELTIHQLVGQLPQPNVAQQLLRLYFENVAWSIAIVSKKTFQAEFLDPCYGGQPDAQRLAVLFLVLALGSLFDPSIPPGANNNPHSRDLFALGRACLALDASASITFGQALFLMVCWLTNGGAVASNQSAWPLLGMAMRVVQMLGLHRNGSHFGLPPSEVQQRARIFWEICSYDINFSCTSARPRSMISANYDTPFPQIEDEDDLYHDFRYRISGLIYAKINDEQAAITPSPYEKAVELDRELREFQQKLPQGLLVEEDYAPSPNFHLRNRHIQRRTTQYKCNLGFLTLHRGWFARALLEEPEEPLKSKYCPSYVGCLEACKMILRSVRQIQDEAPFVSQRRWFYHLDSFTACACLAAAVIRAPRSMLAQSSLSALDDGIKLFEEAGKLDELAMLSRLRETARRRFSHTGPAVPTSDEDLALLGKKASKSPLSSFSQARESAPIQLDTTLHQGLLPMDSFLDAVGMEHPVVAPEGGSPSARNPMAMDLAAGNLLNPFDSDNIQRALGELETHHSDAEIPDFDFNAFLASFGIVDSNNDVLQGGQGDQLNWWGMMG